MSRPNVRDYGIVHISDYPSWQIDRVGTDPRYWDGKYKISADKKTASATDKPSSNLPAPIGVREWRRTTPRGL